MTPEQLEQLQAIVAQMRDLVEQEHIAGRRVLADWADAIERAFS